MQRGEGGRRRWLVGHQGQHTVADHTDMGHSGSIVWTEVVAALLLFFVFHELLVTALLTLFPL